MPSVTDRRFDGLPPDVQAYVLRVTSRLHEALRGDLLSVYLVGSAAFGGFIPGRSDIDIQAVCARDLRRTEKEDIVERLAHPGLVCPTRGCEFVLYGFPDTRTFEINLNSGPEMPFHVAYDPESESAHWFIIDRAIARQDAVAVFGPEPGELIQEVPREALLDAILDSLDWHARHDPAGSSSVLNACRAWKFVETSRWSSKDNAAAWARNRTGNPLIDRALAIRAGTAGEGLDDGAVEAFLEMVREHVRREMAKAHRPALPGFGATPSRRATHGGPAGTGGRA